MTAAPDASLNLGLAEFARDHRSPPVELSDRATAFVLTAAVGGLLVLLVTHRSLWTTPEPPAPAEIVATKTKKAASPAAAKTTWTLCITPPSRASDRSLDSI